MFNAEKLSTLCQDQISMHLDCTIASYICKRDLLQLRDEVYLIREVTEGILSAYIEEGLVLTDRELHIFRDTDKVKISSINLSNSQATDWSLQWLSQHRLSTVDLSGCSELSCDGVQKFVGQMGPHLQILLLGNQAPLLFKEPKQSGLPDDDSQKLCADSDNNSIAPSLDKSTAAAAVTRDGQALLKCPDLRVLSLHTLEYSFTELLFSKLLRPLTKLQHLDLSMCKLPQEVKEMGSLDGLQHLHQLSSLVLHQIFPPNFDLRDHLPVISKLKNLQHLDVSVLRSGRPVKLPSVVSQTEALRSLLQALPLLFSLDISGTHLAGLEEETVGTNNKKMLGDGERILPVGIPGLSGRDFEFLGLLNCVGDPCSRNNLPATRVTGNSTMPQVLESLRVYKKRTSYCNDSLTNLYHLLKDGWTGTLPEYREILQLICDVLKLDRENLDRQISGSAAMFYLIKCDANRPNLHKYANRRLVRQAVRTLYDSVENHFGNKAMLRNGLLTFCHFELPSDVLAIYTQLITQLLLIIRQSDMSRDSFLQKISLYLLNNLVRGVECNEKSDVGNQGAVKIMLWLINSKLAFGETDEIMEMAWSTLWNITDETASNCAKFLYGEDVRPGLNLFIECYNKFYVHGPEHNLLEREALLRNMMGLLGNVSEVKRLRPYFLKPTYIKLFSKLLESTSDGMEVSYHSAGILCHILSDGYDQAAWQQCDQQESDSSDEETNQMSPRPDELMMIDESVSEDNTGEEAVTDTSSSAGAVEGDSYFSKAKETVCAALVAAIHRWDLNSQRSINYRSFKPILALLRCQHTVEVRHWAVWALCNLTTVYPDKYCKLLKDEGGIEMLYDLVMSGTCLSEDILLLANLTLQNCQKVFNSLHINIPPKMLLVQPNATQH